MIYTCYEMVRDCRIDKAEGWSYFLSQYVPVIRKLLAHYAPSGRKLEDILVALRKPESSLFQSAEPAPERWFVAELRQKVLAEFPADTPEIRLELETVAAALEPFTVVEKQVAWLDTMRYSPKETGVMMRMSPETVIQIRGRAAELIRGKVDSWRPTLVSENGRSLGLEATQGGAEECLAQKAFLDVLDGRTTWVERERMERHITGCWHCVDHFCRMVEVVDLMRGLQPLPEAETEPYRQLLGIRMEKPAAWKRLLGRA